jgi:cytochrome c biogenesis protein
VASTAEEAPVTAPRPPAAGSGEPPRPVGLGPVGWARWAWRQLTSMRTALFLLFLLAALAVPGSVFPQRRVDPSAVAAYRERNPELFPWLDRLSMFDVFSSPWFSATYLLLFVSLVGCILPRSRQHWRAMRAQPPDAPRHLHRLPLSRRYEVDEPADVVLDRARTALRRGRFRVRAGESSVAAEKGHLRETGNLVFHVSLLLLLVAFALGNLGGFRANVIVSEGGGFSNARSVYDTFTAGARFSTNDLTPFAVTLDRFDVRYQLDGPNRGEPRDFSAYVTWVDGDGVERSDVIRSNEPLVVGGTKVFLTGNGYAPRFTVRDGTGATVFSGAVPFLPRDGNNTSEGVIKVPDAEPDQLGFAGLFLPTGVITERGPVSVFPDARLPSVALTAYRGDLGLDDGRPQSVYRLDDEDLTQLRADDGDVLRIGLAPGDTAELPDGLGSITFDGVSRFANFQVAHDPGRWPALLGAVLAIGGLMGSLFVRRRRVWVRAVAAEGSGRTVVELGALARTEWDGLEDEVDELSATIVGDAATASPEDSHGHDERAAASETEA